MIEEAPQPQYFNAGNLPEIDQRMIKRGYCPWCVTTRLVDTTADSDGNVYDECPECGDVFTGALTLAD